MIHRHDIALLQHVPASAPARDQPQPALSIARHADPPAILEAHRLLGHRIAPHRVQGRLNNALRFASASLDQRLVASTWLAVGGRYVDELNWLVPVGSQDLWVRDVFVAAPSRGQGLFGALVDALSRQDDGSACQLWSDVDWDATRSIRAHQGAGFKVVARVKAIDFGGLLRWRSALPTWPQPITEIDANARLIWLGGERLRRHRQLLA